MCKRISQSPTVEDCIFCGRPMLVPPGKEAICERCRKDNAVAEAEAIVADARRLINGQWPFDQLADDEWQEQVDALAAELPAAPHVAALDDDQLIQAVAFPASYTATLELPDADGVQAAAAAEVVRRVDRLAAAAPAERELAATG